jgi:hypothetical protein
MANVYLLERKRKQRENWENYINCSDKIDIDDESKLTALIFSIKENVNSDSFNFKE